MWNVSEPGTKAGEAHTGCVFNLVTALLEIVTVPTLRQEGKVRGEPVTRED